MRRQPPATTAITNFRSPGSPCAPTFPERSPLIHLQFPSSCTFDSVLLVFHSQMSLPRSVMVGRALTCCTKKIPARSFFGPRCFTTVESKGAEQKKRESDDGKTSNSPFSSTKSVPVSSKGDLLPGELEGVSFRVEPLRRVGEDAETMRARLTYQSRKRGILETDLLLSTFAATHLERMALPQLRQYDLFLDENDWDIYYWTTQEDTPSPSSPALSPESDPSTIPSSAAPAGPSPIRAPTESQEWAQTVGRFKPAYRPVPARWKDSEILALLREHVRSRKAGEASEITTDGDTRPAKGLGFMPDLPDKRR